MTFNFVVKSPAMKPHHSLSFLLGLLISYILPAQDNQPIELQSLTVESFEPIRSHLAKARVVGMGESTHGTHEFFNSRTQLFQYLVKEFDFTIFYLEADYVNCLPINSYIHGNPGNVEDLVNGIGLWPWMTAEMVDLVNWMREYNQNNPTKKLTFMGVDVQKLEETVTALIDLLGPQSPETLMNLKTVSNDAFYMMKSKAAKRKFEPALDDLAYLSTGLKPKEMVKFKLLYRHLRQVVQVQSTRNQAMRDILMAENILWYSKDYRKKGFFWAHNLHIAKWYFPKKEKGVAGGVLKHHLGEKYMSIGQEFCQGSFNVYFKEKSEGSEKDRGNYTLGPTAVNHPAEGSLASNYAKDYTLPLFIPFAGLPEGEEVRMTAIGARYVIDEDPKSIWRFNHHGRNAFDALILIDRSTPTTLLGD